MSSLRLALKQSLEESGGGSFFSGHGEKKKRKKKKSLGSSSSHNELHKSNGNGSNGNSNESNSNSNSSNSNGSSKSGKSGIKRKRGRPRKHPRPEDDEQTRRKDHSLSSLSSPNTNGNDPSHTNGNTHNRTTEENSKDDDDDDDGEFSSENEFSCSDEESYDYDDSDEEGMDDSEEEEDGNEEDGTGHRRRNRRRGSGHHHHRHRHRHDEEGFQEDEDDHDDMEDETMHSDDDDDIYSHAATAPDTASTTYTTADRTTTSIEGKQESLGSSSTYEPRAGSTTTVPTATLEPNDPNQTKSQQEQEQLQKHHQHHQQEHQHSSNGSSTAAEGPTNRDRNHDPDLPSGPLSASPTATATKPPLGDKSANGPLSSNAANDAAGERSLDDTSSTAAAEEEMRKKIKLLKLKKKLERNNQNSAANKIQNQWKKKKDTVASVSNSASGVLAEGAASTVLESLLAERASAADSSTAVGNGTSASASVIASNIGSNNANTNNISDNNNGGGGHNDNDYTEGDAANRARLDASSDGPSFKSSLGDRNEPRDGNKSSSNGVERMDSNGDSDVAATTTTALPLAKESAVSAATSTTNTIAAGDGGKIIGVECDGEQQLQQQHQEKATKKNKKKNNSNNNNNSKNNGAVPAPSREVVLWGENMSQKKARKAIGVGMRVKVRFSTNATKLKKDGRRVSKRLYYGGRVTAKTPHGSRIKIRYDDKTSEVSSFPDKDVVVDAFGNGEHSVPADAFVPPQAIKDPVKEEANTKTKEPPAEEQLAMKEAAEEGEIQNAANVDVNADAAIEDGEVEETETIDRTPKARSSYGDAQRNTIEYKKETDHKTGETPMTPPPELSRNDANGGDERVSPAPTPEEGELSPGITKNGEGDQQQQQKQHPSIAQMKTKIATELKPSSPEICPPITEDNVAAVVTIMEGENSNQGALDSHSPSSKPKATKKLSIRIPGLATIKAKALASPKSEAISPSVANASSKKSPVAISMDDILADTPETKGSDKAAAKRKRASEVITPSTDDASLKLEPFSKRRIKVVIGKSLNENVASAIPQDMVDAMATATAVLTAEDGTTKVKPEQFEEIKLAPPAEKSVGETKKKKKKADRAKSPGPKSPIPKPASSQQSKNESSETSKEKPQIGSSNGCAFEKKSLKEDESSKQTSLEASMVAESMGSPTAAHRTGRKAAVDAKEKMSAKQKAKLAAKELKEKEKEDHLPESGKKKKKRRRQEDVEEHKPDSDTEQNDTEWVQCDSCKKWRVLPDTVKGSPLPEQWYCHMNIYDKKRSNCQAPEQNQKEALKERKERKRRLKLKKRARREAELAESQQQGKKAKLNDEETATTTTSMTKKKSKLEKLNAEKQAPRSTSPKLTKAVKSKGSTVESKKAIAETKRANVELGKKSEVKSSDQVNPTDSGSDTKKENKKKGKKAKKEAQENSDNQDTDAGVDGKKRKRGRPARNQAITAPSSASNGKDKDKEDEDNVEWVQCDKCQKWRKLPPHISADELPEIWNCSMNNWNPGNASCQAAEDKTDAHHQEVGTSEWQLRQTHAGKYSYRQMIFGAAARKPNRPPSERARAAESLFVMQSNDEENPVATTQYTKSSAFLPRVSNFSKNNAIEEKSLGIFSVLQKSSLWDKLRRMDHNPAKVLSSNGSNIPGYPKMMKTYECLSNDIKHAMQDVVLHTLEFGCLSADEVIGKTQWFPCERVVSGGVKGYCNPDIIIHTLLDLVQDGLVEMNTARDPHMPIAEWVPRYRRVGTRRAMEAVEAIKASRCMKISKPWKQRSNEPTEEWVTGKQRKS